MENLWIHNMQKVLNNLKIHYIDGHYIILMKLMIVMVLNYMKDKNALLVKMFYQHMQVEIGHYQKEKVYNNVNILIFNLMEEECYLHKNLVKKKEDNNLLILMI